MKFWFQNVGINFNLREIEKLNKDELTLLTHFFTGFNRMRSHARKIDKNLSGRCELCGADEETSIHLVTGCGPLNGLVNWHLGTLRDGLWTVDGVLAFVRDERVAQLLGGR